MMAEQRPILNTFQYARITYFVINIISTKTFFFFLYYMNIYYCSVPSFIQQYNDNLKTESSLFKIISL